MPFARQMPPNTKQNFTDIWETLDEKLCWSRERTLRDPKERNKGLPVSQASVGGWSKCNPKYSILYLYIFQDVWSCLYSGFCLSCHVCGCHFGLQVIPALFEWRGIIIIIIIISQLFFIQIIINNIILINNNSESEDNMITCSYNLTCRHTRCSLFHDSWHESSLKLFSIIFTPQKPCSDARNWEFIRWVGAKYTFFRCASISLFQFNSICHWISEQCKQCEQCNQRLKYSHWKKYMQPVKDRTYLGWGLGGCFSAPSPLDKK